MVNCKACICKSVCKKVGAKTCNSYFPRANFAYVVRCENCQYCEEQITADGVFMYECHAPHEDCKYKIVEPYNFCAWGIERS